MFQFQGPTELDLEFLNACYMQTNTIFRSMNAN